MKRFHSNLDWGSDAKYNDSRKNIRSVSGKIFCELETQKLRLKIKIHPFSISQSAASQLKLLQASTEDYKPAYLGKTEFQYLLWHIDKKLNFQACQDFEAKKSKGTQKTLRSRNKRFSEQWKIRSVANRLYPWKITGSTHTFAFILYSKLNSPHFFAASSSILFLNANITIKSYQEGK